MRQSIALPVADLSHVGEARRMTARLTEELGLPEHERGLAALVVTELGNNLAKYAKDGQLVIRALGDGPVRGIEILSLDSGPGFSDVAGRVEDGYSSGRTPGNGLGAVKRSSSYFDIYSSPGSGTAIMCRIVPAGGAAVPAGRVEFGVVCVPIHGEDRCGDSWGVYHDGLRAVFMLVDGLGHGVIAATAADEAVRIFEAYHDRSPADIMGYAHGALRSTRGAVMAVAETNLNDGRLSYVGVGNIAGCFIGSDDRDEHMISVNGTVGLVAKPKVYTYTWQRGALLVMHSDGLQSRWQLDRFPGLLARHPSLIAGVLYQHYTRGRDDVSVLVARWSPAKAC